MCIRDRMNIGQVLEVHLGSAAAELGWKIMTPVFDGAKETEISKALEFAKITRDIYPCEEIENKAVFMEVDTEKGGKDLQRSDKEWIAENKEAVSYTHLRFKEMKRRHDIKTGKIVPGAKRYHRVRRRLVDLDDVQDEYFGEDDGKDLPPRPGSDGANAW